MVPTVVSSYSEFQSKFGDSFLSGSNYYTYLTSIAAQQYLRHSNKLTVVRILDGTYSGANAEVPAALGVGAVATGSIALHADFMTDEGDELRIVKGGTTFRFQAADPTAVPDDNASGNLYFHATGSDGTTAVVPSEPVAWKYKLPEALSSGTAVGSAAWNLNVVPPLTILNSSPSSVIKSA